MSQLLPTSSKYVKNNQGEDLIDIAAKLGINMFRITNTMRAIEDGQDAIYTKKQWDTVLNKMQSKGIKALILIETASNNPDVFDPEIKPAYLRLVQQYIIQSGVLFHPDVYGIDLKNEPIVNNPNNMSMIREAARMIKAVNPQIHLTVGYWRVDTFQKDQEGKPIYEWEDHAIGKVFEDIVDFHTVHMYGLDRQVFGFYPDAYQYTRDYLSDIKSSLNTSKPVLIGEFGGANGEAISDQDTIGSPQLQANIYQGVYQALNESNDPQILGSIAYQLNAKTNLPDSWAILKNNGDTLFPAADVLQKYAKAKPGAIIPPPFENIPNDYIFTNSDNETTRSISTGDIIGLKLELDPESFYNILLSNDNLKQTGPFTYDRNHNKYYAVLHAINPGTTRISINQAENKTVFSITIIVR